MITAEVDVAADIAVINRGDAQRLGDHYVVHGRRYGMEPTGRLFPIEGTGFISLTRTQFRALGVYNEFGLTARAEVILDAREIMVGDREVAREVWLRGHGDL